MVSVPARPKLTALAGMVNEVVGCAGIGFARSLDDRVAFFYSQDNGLGEYLVPVADTPDVLLPQAPGILEADVAGSGRETAPEWILRLMSARHVVSLPLADTESPTRFWAATAAQRPLTPDQLSRLEIVARKSREAILETASADERLRELERLERTARLLPALLKVLDVRDVFDRVSDIAREALPHDLLLLRLFSDDLSSITIFARSDRGSDLGPVVPHLYPASVTRCWSYGIVDDLTKHPIEASQPAVKLGARASLRVPIRVDDRVIAGVGFVSFEPGRFGSDDVPIAKRLADHVAVGLSHHRLAEEGRRTAALRERANNLEMLDGLLDTLTGVLDIRQVFDRVSAIAQRVLPHDALSIAEILGDGTMVRLHATHGLGDVPEPLDLKAPDPRLVTEEWDYRIIDDARERPEYAGGPGAAAGMRSMMFVSIKLEGRNFGGLNFYARTPGRFTKEDVLIGRRITDHVALALSHRRLAEQARQHEALRAVAARNELLDGLLATLIDSGELADVFEKVSAIAGKVVPHDAAALMIRIANGPRARTYASSGFPDSVPGESEIPGELLDNPDWDHDIFDDLQSLSGAQYARLVRMGFRSLMRVSIRLEGRWAGALLLVSARPAAFGQGDLPVAHRLADRLSAALAHDREVAASRRADEATERASKLEARVRALTDELDARTGYRRVVGDSSQWRQVLTHAAQVAPTETTVLLLGESGTGKEVVARFLHRASGRKQGPFVALNCAALPEQLLEAELFGYERGAYTGATQSKPGQLEQAAGGTLFLDEVGEMSPSAQAKFLRVLQEREFQRLGGTRVLRTDARVVAATNRDLPRAIANGQFRDDLFYRLNVFAIRLPSLRDRRDDILPLSEAFLKEIGGNLGRPPGGITREARQLLIDYHWPGNVRELRNILERAAILCDGGLITADHLAFTVTRPPQITAPTPATRPPNQPASAPPPDAAPASPVNLQFMERTMIEQALQNARFNKSKAAKALGLTRHQLYIRMRRHGLDA
jgi:transcriptional regulator with GAF, ATPase, and Fis domain